MFVTLHEKSGFKANSPVRIFQGGRIFYECDKGKEFNLPKGEFFVNGDISPIPFIVYKPDFYVSKHPLVQPKKLKVITADNPHKCTVFPATGLTILDRGFLKYPTYFTVFVLLHEKGHSYYRGEGEKSEIECDNYAKKVMLEEGYNPSQIALCQDATLKSERRKYITREQMKKLKKT